MATATDAITGSMPSGAQSALDAITGQLNWTDSSGKQWIQAQGSGEVIDPYQSQPIASYQQYWGQGDKTTDVTQLRSSLSGPAWDAYNKLIQQFPQLQGKIMNPDAIAAGVTSQGSGVVDPESNLPKFEYAVQNALLNQPAVVQARGSYVDVTDNPQAQQALQQGQQQAQANQDYTQKYGGGGPWTKEVMGGVTDILSDPLVQAALLYASAGAASGAFGAADAAAGAGEAGAAGAAGGAGAAGAGSNLLSQAALGALKGAGLSEAGQLATQGEINPKGTLLGALTGGVGAGVTPAISSLLQSASSIPGGIANLLAKLGTGAGMSALTGGNPLASAAGTLAGAGAGEAASDLGASSGVASGIGSAAGNVAGKMVNQATQQTPSGLSALAAPSAPAAPSTQSLNSQNAITQAAPQTAPTQSTQQSTQSTQPTSQFEAGMARFAPGYYTYGTPMTAAQAMAPSVAGYKRGGRVWGAGGGQDDLIPAYLADGEYVMDAQVVSALGGGSSKEGAKILDEFRKKVREHSRSAPVDKIPPKPKSPLEYLKDARREAR